MQMLTLIPHRPLLPLGGSGQNVSTSWDQIGIKLGESTMTLCSCEFTNLVVIMLDFDLAQFYHYYEKIVVASKVGNDNEQ